MLWLCLWTEGEGHAIVMESSPSDGQVLMAPPSRLVIRFNSRIVHALSRVILVGPDRHEIHLQLSNAGSPVPDRLVLPLPTLTPGTYAVQWQVLSEDGHLTRGSFSFKYFPAPGRR